MSITTLTIPMGKITAPGAELTRAATVLQEGCTAMLAFYRGELLVNVNEKVNQALMKK